MSLLRFHFWERKKILLMVSLLLRFIFVKICLITVRGNETTCCVTALFCTVSLPLLSNIHLTTHLSISLSFSFCLPVPLLFRILMYALLSKLRMSWLFRVNSKKWRKKELETNVQTDRTPTQMACLLTETAL